MLILRFFSTHVHQILSDGKILSFTEKYRLKILLVVSVHRKKNCNFFFQYIILKWDVGVFFLSTLLSFYVFVFIFGKEKLIWKVSDFNVCFCIKNSVIKKNSNYFKSKCRLKSWLDEDRNFRFVNLTGICHCFVYSLLFARLRL